MADLNQRPSISEERLTKVSSAGKVFLSLSALLFMVHVYSSSGKGFVHLEPCETPSGTVLIPLGTPLGFIGFDKLMARMWSD
jgi:hypothetical protein